MLVIDSVECACLDQYDYEHLDDYMLIYPRDA